MPSINDLPEAHNISPATFKVLSTLANLSSADLADHLDLTMSILLAYEGADISTEIQAVTALICTIQAKLRSESAQNTTD